MRINNPKSRINLVYRYIPILLLAISSVLFVTCCLDIAFIQDDAYTSFRYAKNFAEGNGLVYNIGERVEGYTSFLFVVSILYTMSPEHR